VDISGRKADHVRLAAASETATGAGPGFADVSLIHNALPELDLASIDPSVELFGRRFELPLWIASMTGGHAAGRDINAILARVAERRQIPMGVGSQRAALRDPALRDSYQVARREAPSVFLLANVGAAQLVDQGSTAGLRPAEVGELVAMIQADAVVVHLNPIQELAQPEGDRNAAGWLAAIARLVAELPIPVIAKETGGGVSEPVARRLADAGVAAIDVGGRGGTSFAAIEGSRAEERGVERAASLAAALRDWGIPTAVSVVLAARAGLPVVATGGVRTGIDAARAIVLGASAVGVARPLLKAALDGGDEAVDTWIEGFRDQLLAAQFLTGSRTIADLRRASHVVAGETRSWLDALAAGPVGGPPSAT
jgi:isopentenyl-diphosphate delta-isomerase